MQVRDGIVREANGTLALYYNDEKQYDRGGIMLDGNLYYVRPNGVVVSGCDWYVPKDKAYLFGTAGMHTFNEDGTMQIKHGLVQEADGTLGFYDMDRKLYGGLIMCYDYNYYYLRSNGVVVQDMDWYVSDGRDTTVGMHTFRKDGTMVTKAQIVHEKDGTLGYYIDGVKQYGNGVIYYYSNIYFVKADGTLATNCKIPLPYYNVTDPESGWSIEGGGYIAQFDERGVGFAAHAE